MRRWILGTAIAASILGGCGSAVQTTAPTPAAVATLSATPSLVGTVHYQDDGVPATTAVDADADGASVSGTAVSTFASGIHTVDLECATRDGDTWAFGGTVEQTTVPGESAGSWSAVIVRDGTPQRVGIWLSDTKVDGVDCAGWLAAIEMSTIDASNFNPVETGELVPPPDLAS